MIDTTPASRTTTTDVHCARCEKSFPLGTPRCDTCKRVLPGNQIARKHGAAAVRNGNTSTFTAEERQLAESDIDRIAEDLDVPTTVTALFYRGFLLEQHLIIAALDRYFAEHGYLTSRGRPRAALQMYQQAQDRFDRFVRRLEDLAADHGRRNPGEAP